MFGARANEVCGAVKTWSWAIHVWRLKVSVKRYDGGNKGWDLSDDARLERIKAMNWRRNRNRPFGKMGFSPQLPWQGPSEHSECFGWQQATFMLTRVTVSHWKQFILMYPNDIGLSRGKSKIDAAPEESSNNSVMLNLHYIPILGTWHVKNVTIMSMLCFQL